MYVNIILLFFKVQRPLICYCHTVHVILYGITSPNMLISYCYSLWHNFPYYVIIILLFFMVQLPLICYYHTFILYGITWLKMFLLYCYSLWYNFP